MSKISKKNLIIVAIIIGILLIAGIIVYLTQIKTGEKPLKVLTYQEAGDKVIKYINENFLQGGVQASLVSITTENALYTLKLKVENEEFDAYVTKDGKFLFVQPPIDLDKKITTQKSEEQEKGTSTIGDFLISTDEICKENGKPIVYFFGSSGCPHCRWEHPIVENIASKFSDNIVFRGNMDSDNDAEVFAKYSTGGYVPAVVLGCKYYRVGSGEQSGEEAESRVLTALICKLTENKPESVCNPVQELINQIQ